ncbi:MAG: DUF2723 domain-containing protein [Bacteroidales bacterium]|nr:DUF2723 domain-containing protein [Bacteroidales bacterium]
MTEKRFRTVNRIVSLAVLAIATTTYLLTIEPTVSFWDCGEFIASSYKLEVGHPPGNPAYQLFARFFTLFTDKENAAAAINALSAICSALTIFFLYLTIVFFAKRIVLRKGEEMIEADVISICGAGAVGALAYCFSDTFWFSAVEAEVYAMSSLFTAVVFWAMTRWYDEADEPHSGRWIVLICFLMGLSIGVHLLNLLSIPAIVFMYFYRIREDRKYSFMELCGIFILSCLILAVVLFGIIPLLPKAAAYTDLLFVNVFGLPFNSGAVTFMTLLFAGLFYGLFQTLKRGKVLANTVLLCLTTIITGFSLYATVVIRSNANTPMNENKPDNPFTLISYLNREQYPKGPIIYGEYFGADYDVSEKEYWARIGDRYVKGKSIDIEYTPESKMFFPRMWDYRDDSYIDIYKLYIGEDGRKVPGSIHLKPTFLQNLVFFFDYQLNWMYWRYFLWNFAGRQNDIHSPIPGDIFKGNWECGIGFIDKIRLGDQSDAPTYLKDNKGRNHYYMLPLLLGLIGLFFQYSRDRRGCWLSFLMFFMTGIAIVLYLNQSPLQVRERDYAYAGSFYFFSAWIGLGVSALISRFVRSKNVAPCLVIVVSCLGVPALMAAENWDDHDRSNRYTARELGMNYLRGVGENGILVTHGDNDTFPIWYAQEVEGFRTDVRVVNTSLLGADWHIDQMKQAVYESAPLDLSIGKRQYLQGENEYVLIYDTRDTVLPLSDVMKVFRHPDAKIPLTNGQYADYIASRRFSIPVNKENVIRYGILDERFADMIPSEIVLEIPEEKQGITKPELFFLDLLSNYEWDRPLNFLSAGGDIKIGIKDYLMYDGFTYRFIPIKNKTNLQENGFTDVQELYRKMTSLYTWDTLKKEGWYVDYQNLYTFAAVMSQRKIFSFVAQELIEAGENEKAVDMLDMCQKMIPERSFPLDLVLYGFNNEYDIIRMIEAYHMAGAPEKASELGARLADALLESTAFFLNNYEDGKSHFDLCYNLLAYLSALEDEYGDSALATSIRDRFNNLL